MISRSVISEEQQSILDFANPASEQFPLDESNFVMYCAKNWDHRQSLDNAEFNDDLKRIKYIRRIFNKYLETGDIKERLALNHVIVTFNVFGLIPANKILCFRLHDQLPQLLPFLDFLAFTRPKVYNLGLPRFTINTNDVARDQIIAGKLQSI